MRLVLGMVCSNERGTGEHRVTLSGTGLTCPRAYVYVVRRHVWRVRELSGSRSSVAPERGE